MGVGDFGKIISNTLSNLVKCPPFTRENQQGNRGAEVLTEESRDPMRGQRGKEEDGLDRGKYRQKGKR